MPVPAKRRTKSQKRRRASHHALKAMNIGKSGVPHSLKRASGLNKLKLR